MSQAAITDLLRQLAEFRQMASALAAKLTAIAFELDTRFKDEIAYQQLQALDTPAKFIAAAEASQWAVEFTYPVQAATPDWLTLAEVQAVSAQAAAAPVWRRFARACRRQFGRDDPCWQRELTQAVCSEQARVGRLDGAAARCAATLQQQFPQKRNLDEFYKLPAQFGAYVNCQKLWEGYLLHNPPHSTINLHLARLRDFEFIAHAQVVNWRRGQHFYLTFPPGARLPKALQHGAVKAALRRLLALGPVTVAALDVAISWPLVFWVFRAAAEQQSAVGLQACCDKSCSKVCRNVRRLSRTYGRAALKYVEIYTGSVSPRNLIDLGTVPLQSCIGVTHQTISLCANWSRLLVGSSARRGAPRLPPELWQKIWEEF